MGATRSRSEQESCYEINYIKEEAVKLLLAGLGQEEWYGLFSDGPGRLYGKQGEMGMVNSILADMYQNGIIDWKDAGVAVRQPYADMLAVMLDKKLCVSIQMCGTAAPLRCCYYSGSEVVITLKSQREEGTLGMVQMPVQEWAGLLGRECARLEDGESCVLTRRSSQDGSILQNVRIKRGGLRSILMEWGEGWESSLRCAQEEFGEKLRGLLCMDGSQTLGNPDSTVPVAHREKEI